MTLEVRNIDVQARVFDNPRGLTVKLSTVHLSFKKQLTTMRNVLIIFSLVVLDFLSVSAQNEARFYAELSTPEVVVGEPIKVSFILENGKNNGRFTPPDWESAGFLVLGSSQSSNISIMNGQTSAFASYNFTITPVEEGTLIIPAVSIKNGDSELFTKPITIQALPNADGVRPALPKRTPSPPQPEPKKRFKTIRM
ncbi:MAG: BatD family protein [Saprospiraceae bacterium]|nr:BatD family protein [Saprospiraceae bacterium]